MCVCFHVHLPVCQSAIKYHAWWTWPQYRKYPHTHTHKYIHFVQWEEKWTTIAIYIVIVTGNDIGCAWRWNCFNSAFVPCCSLPCCSSSSKMPLNQREADRMGKRERERFLWQNIFVWRIYQQNSGARSRIHQPKLLFKYLIFPLRISSGFISGSYCCWCCCYTLFNTNIRTYFFFII